VEDHSRHNEVPKLTLVQF